MSSKLNLIGERYEMLTVVSESEPIPRKNGKLIRTWKCVCDCGNETVVRQSDLRSGDTKSCGCLSRKRKNIIGNKYGRLTVIGDAEDYVNKKSGKSQRMMLCECECGTNTTIRYDGLVTGNSKSCGCYARDASKIPTNVTHGLSNHPLYKTWIGMKKRCCNSASQDYNDYGARGIIVCDEWISNAEEFIRWAESEANWKPGSNLSIDRIDVYGNYEPSNCRFANNATQAYNRRVFSNNKSGYAGVTYRGGKWISKISIKGKRIALGTYSTIELAAEARQLKEIELFGYVFNDKKIATEKVRQEINRIIRESLS